MKSNEVLEFLVLGQLDNIREVYLGLERGVRLLVQTVPGALPLKPLVNLRHSWLKCKNHLTHKYLAFAVLLSFMLNIFSTIFLAIFVLFLVSVVSAVILVNQKSKYYSRKIELKLDKKFS